MGDQYNCIYFFTASSQEDLYTVTQEYRCTGANMIKGLNIASQGMQQAERRATDLAAEILKTTSQAASFKLEDADPQTATSKQPQGSSAPPVGAPSGPGFSDLLQQMVDLKAEEQAFRANATVFKRLDETFDEGLGSLLDEEG